MLSLIVAGEAIFALPFHLARFFRPTVLEVFNLTNTELGAAQGAYGVFAMLSYFLGGPLADRFAARKLLAWSLWCTAMGGAYMLTFPGYRGASVLWAIFGVTTILLFWAALIRATRDWGGSDRQGRAYGLLDGGRGLLAAVLATLAVGIFGLVFPEDQANASLAQKREALRLVIIAYTALTVAAGFLAWFAIAEREPRSQKATANNASPLKGLSQVMRMPAVWLQATIVVCAYVGYKGFDNYSLFAVQAYGLNEVDAAGLVAMASWMRPVAALGAGMLGDRFGVARLTVLSFLLLFASQLYFGLATPGAAWILLANTLVTCTAIFALRGLYFALFQEARVPMAVTGTAVGVVSVIGFTPDIFVALVGGILLDRTPGLVGHQHYFQFLATFAFLGLVASTVFLKRLSDEALPAAQLR
ncbi:MAG: MFS transporter [Pseudomonadota bacterium]